MSGVDYVVQRERLLEGRKREQAPFRICRRIRFMNMERLAPWDKQDNCAECSEPVVYDSRDSEGLPHICWPCAYTHRLSFLSPDSPISELAASMDSLSDAEIQRRMQATLSQNQHGENRNNLPSAPPRHRYRI